MSSAPGRLLKRFHASVARNDEELLAVPEPPTVAIMAGLVLLLPVPIAQWTGAPGWLRLALEIGGAFLLLAWMTYLLGFWLRNYVRIADRQYQERRKHLSKEYRED